MTYPNIEDVYLKGEGDARYGKLASISPIQRILAAVRSPRFSRDVSPENPTITVQVANAVPSAWSIPLASAVRHMIARQSGSGGNLDLDSLIYRYNRAIWQNQLNYYQANDGTASFNFMPGDPAALNGSQNYSPAVVGFKTDSPYFGIPYTQATRVLVIIDGKPHAATAATSGAAQQYLTISFASRKQREIIVVSGPFGRIGEIAAGQLDTFSPLDTTRGSFTAAAMSDSYGGYYGAQHASFIAEALYGLGTVNLMHSSVGTTGFGADQVAAGALKFTAASRLNYMLSAAPDLIWIAGGINDAFPTGPYGDDIATNIRAVIAAARAASPLGLIVAQSPWAPNETNGQGATPQAIRASILAGLQLDKGPWVFLDSLNGGWITSWGTSASGLGRWQTGTGSNGAGTGNGNLYIQADATHPVQPDGVTFYARRAESDLRQAILSLPG